LLKDETNFRSKLMVSSEITSIVKEWQSYLELQKNYSKNTREAYLNDVKAYFAFIIRK